MLGLLALGLLGTATRSGWAQEAPAPPSATEAVAPAPVAVLPFGAASGEVPAPAYHCQAILLCALERVTSLRLLPGDAVARVAFPPSERTPEKLGQTLLAAVQSLGAAFVISGVIAEDGATVRVYMARAGRADTAPRVTTSDAIPTGATGDAALVAATLDALEVSGQDGVVEASSLIGAKGLAMTEQALAATDAANAAAAGGNNAASLEEDALAVGTLMPLVADLGELPRLTAPVEYVCRAALVRRPNMMQAILGLGLVHFSRGAYDQALGACDRALTVSPSEPRVYNLQGLAHEARGEIEAAQAAFEQAVAVDPRFAMAHCNLGRVIEARGDQAAATAHYRQAIELNTDPRASALAHVALAAPLLEGASPDYAGALKHLDEALAVDVALAEAHYNRGIALVGLGRTDEGTAAYRTAIEQRPAYAEAWNNLGVALYSSGNTQEAAAAYARALEAKPTFALAHRNLAIARERQEDFQAAEAEWQAYLAAGAAISPEDAALARQRLRYAQRMAQQEAGR